MELTVLVLLAAGLAAGLAAALWRRPRRVDDREIRPSGSPRAEVRILGSVTRAVPEPHPRKGFRRVAGISMDATPIDELPERERSEVLRLNVGAVWVDGPDAYRRISLTQVSITPVS